MPADLEAVFRRVAPRPTTPAPVEEIIRRGRRQRVAVLALAVAGATAVAVLTPAVVGSLREGARDVAGPRVGPVERVATTAVDEYPVALAHGEGAVWVATAKGTIQRIDPATDEVVATVSIVAEENRRTQGPEEGPDDEVAPAWTASRFGTVTTGAGAVWVTASTDGGFACRLFEIDPATNEVVANAHVDGCYPFAVTPSAIWVGESGPARRNSRLVELDRDSLEEKGEVELGPCCLSGIAYERGYVWVGRQVVGGVWETGSNGIPILGMELDAVQVDPRRHRVVSEIPLAEGAYHPGDTLLSNTMSSNGSSVWLTRPEAAFVDVIDAVTGAVRLRVALDRLRMPDNPVATPRWVAVPDLHGSRVALLDAESGEVVDIFDTQADMGGNAVTNGEFLWVAHPEEDAVVKLRVRYP